MADIRMSPEQMRDRAAEYSAEGDKFTEVVNKMTSLVSALDGEWDGDAKAAFLTKFDELKPGFDKTKELIYDISNALKATADAYEQRDSEIAGAFK